MNTRHALPIIAMLALTAGCDKLPSAGQTDATAPAATAPVVEGVVVATVNGTPLTQSVLDVYATQRKSQGANPEDSDPEAMLNELIALELMRQEGVSKGLNSLPMVVAALNQQERTSLAGAAIKDFMNNNPVSDEAAQELYDAQIGKPGKEYNARHILLESEEDARAVIVQLDEGADFSELAKEKSTGPSGSSGGKLGWFGAGQMVAPFSEAASKLAKGEYTKEPVQTQFGWHVIILDDTRESTPPPFADVKDRLKMLLANQQLQQHVEELKNSANIEIKE
ncbi:MAG TPA: peptidylprolyl isomerase [Gammaproteobacteria bacterium]|nr:peptidylprolyl isomerase [Gammaproteobacteria bacterium]